MFRKRWVAVAALAAAGYAAPAASAETIYGLTDANDLVVFDSATPGTVSTLDVTLPNGVTSIEGIDVRPATLQLFALGNNGQVFRIDTVSGLSTAVNQPLALDGADFDIDFNPTVDLLRVVSDSEQNLRVNLRTGAVTQDGALSPEPPERNVTGAAYTNNAPASAQFPAAPTTTLFDVDTGTDQLLTQNPPNSGTLVDGKALTVDLVGDVGFDISTVSTPGTGAPGTNTAYLVGRDASTLDRLYTVNTDTGAATAVGEIGGSSKVKDLAVAAPVPLLAVLISGPLGIGQQQLATVRADRPTEQASAPVPVTGLQNNESLVGIDRRPNGGTVYGIGSTGRVYTLNLATGAASPVTTNPFTLTGSAFGVDFNPIPDLIRIVSDADQNLRVSPVTGNLTNTDQPLNNQVIPPNVTGAAYTNPVSPAPAATTLFDLDTGSDQLAIQNPPNDGTLTYIGSFLNAGGAQAATDQNGYDIAARFNQQFAALQDMNLAGSALFAVNAFTAAAGQPATGGSVRIGDLTLGATRFAQGLTVVQDNVLPAAPTPAPTATPTATATYTVPTPTATATPGPYTQKVKPNITAKAKPKKDTRKPFIFRVQGKLTFPSSVSKAAGCKGTVRIVAKKGKKVIAKRRTGIKTTCKYKARVKLRKSAGKRGTAKFAVQYLGSNVLLKDSAKTKAKYGKKKRK